MNAEFFDAIEMIEKEKGIPRGYMYDKIKQAMLTAFRKDYPECEDNVEIVLDEEKKRIEMHINKTVVDQVEDPSHEIILEAAKKISRRAKLGELLGLGFANAKTFLKRLNHYGVTREEFERAVAELNAEGEENA